MSALRFIAVAASSVRAVAVVSVMALALRVTVGLVMMSILLVLAVAGRVTASHRLGFELVSWYWHFVDVVWIVVFTVVYLIGR